MRGPGLWSLQTVSKLQRGHCPTPQSTWTEAYAALMHTQGTLLDPEQLQAG